MSLCDEKLEQEKPWEVFKLKEEEFMARYGGALASLAYSLVGLRSIARLLQPFMPNTAATIDQTINLPRVQHITKAAPLFPRIELNK